MMNTSQNESDSHLPKIHLPVEASQEERGLLVEFAEKFRQNATQLLDDLKSHCALGEIEGAKESLEKLCEISTNFGVEPLVQYCDQAGDLASEGGLSEIKNTLVPKMETALQATIGLLRTENLLDEATILPESLDKKKPIA